MRRWLLLVVLLQVSSEQLDQQIYAYKLAPSKVHPAERIAVATILLEDFTPIAHKTLVQKLPTPADPGQKSKAHTSLHRLCAPGHHTFTANTGTHSRGSGTFYDSGKSVCFLHRRIGTNILW